MGAIGMVRTSAGRPVAAATAVVASGFLNGYALGTGAAHDGWYVWAGLMSAIPVALTLAMWVLRRPVGGGLASVGLLTFSAVLVLEAVGWASPQPLPLAAGCILALGIVLVAGRRARAGDVLEGLLLACAGSAFVYEATIALHSL